MPVHHAGRSRIGWLARLGLLASLSPQGLGCGHAIPVAATFRGDAGIAADANVRGVVDLKLPSAVDPGEMTTTVVRAGRGHAPRPARIALVDVDGVLLNQNYGSLYAVGDNPLAGFRDKLEAAARDPQVAAVVLRINSPGGSVTTCDVMAEELRRFKAETRKPVVACLMDLATSGAYFVAVEADRIVAHPTAVTGGLGVVFNHYNLQDAMAQLNLTADSVKSGARIDMGTVTAPLDPETRVLIQQMTDAYRDHLQRRVKSRRIAMTARDQQVAGDGRVFLASQAMRVPPGRPAGLHPRRDRRGRAPGRPHRRGGRPVSPGRLSRPFALRHHAQPRSLERGHPVQLSWSRPIPIADVPLFMAARPDPATSECPMMSSRSGLIEDVRRGFASGWDGREPEPSDWPVLVTGAGGFVGGHVARDLAASGHRVRGVSRRPPVVEPDDPPIDWVIGDLREADTRRRTLAGCRGVIHTAGWVSLGLDPGGASQTINVELTRQLLAEARLAGVERFVYTSTLYTVAAGTADQPADEFTAWNLERVDSPYTRSKREAERLVLGAGTGRFSTIALCPGMVMGPRDHKPTSTAIVRAMARSLVAVLPHGGIPIVDAGLLALAHRRALVTGGEGQRYAVLGPYLSYHELAAVVASIAGRPRWIVTLPDRLEPVLSQVGGWLAPAIRRWVPDFSGPLIAGGFLRLHVRGDRADRCFGLEHPLAVESIARSL